MVEWKQENGTLTTAIPAYFLLRNSGKKKEENNQ